MEASPSIHLERGGYLLDQNILSYDFLVSFLQDDLLHTFERKQLLNLSPENGQEANPEDQNQLSNGKRSKSELIGYPRYP